VRLCTSRVGVENYPLTVLEEVQPVSASGSDATLHSTIAKRLPAYVRAFWTWLNLAFALVPTA
jgi:hypothetical protein